MSKKAETTCDKPISEPKKVDDQKLAAVTGGWAGTWSGKRPWGWAA